MFKKALILLVAAATVGAVAAFASHSSVSSTVAEASFYQVENGPFSVNAGQEDGGPSSCHPGDKVIGGGMLQEYTTAPSPDVVMTQSFPSSSGPNTGEWSVEVYNSDSVSHQFVVYAICHHS